MRHHISALWLALALSTTAMTAIAQENDIKVYPPDDVYAQATGNPRLGSLFISGEIDRDLAEEVEQLVEDMRLDGGSVTFHSPGGNLLAGIELGQVIRRAGLSTNVGRDGGSPADVLSGGCYSACVLAYAGGSFRHLAEGSELGVHRFSSEVQSDSDLDIGQVMSAAITNHLSTMGVSPELFERMVTAGRDEMYILGLKESRELNLVNGGRPEPDWSLEIVDGGYYLRGSQDSPYGAGTNMLLCAGGTVSLATKYHAGPNAERVLSEATRHSLRVDGEFIDMGEPRQWTIQPSGYVVGHFDLHEHLKARIMSADSFGHAVHSPNPDLFWGYTVDTTGGKQKIRDLFNTCR